MFSCLNVEGMPFPSDSISIPQTLTSNDLIKLSPNINQRISNISSKSMIVNSLMVLVLKLLARL